MTTHNSRATTRACAIDDRRATQAATALREMTESAATVVEALAAPAPAPRVRLIADLLAAMLGDGAPRALIDGASPIVSAPELARSEGVAHLASSLWRRLVQLEQLTPSRAAAIAVRLAPMMRSPLQLSWYAHEADEHGCKDAATALRDELSTRFPAFVASKVWPDRAALELADFDLSKVDVGCDGEGRITSLTRRRAKPGKQKGKQNSKRRSRGDVVEEGPRLTIDAPGNASFHQVGKSGGYGFCVSERYERGAARGVLMSPWHDGEEYATKTPWLVWLLECIGTLTS